MNIIHTLSHLNTRTAHWLHACPGVASSNLPAQGEVLGLRQLLSDEECEWDPDFVVYIRIAW